MLLENRAAIVYGASGAMGGAVSRAFAREGARLFLAGRTLATLDALADELRGRGATVDTALGRRDGRRRRPGSRRSGG